MKAIRLQLYFCQQEGQWALERIRFRPRPHDAEVESVRGDRYGRLGRSFSWTRAMRALSLLLVSHVWREASAKALQGGVGTPAQTLFNLLEHPERSSAAAPFTAADGRCHLKRLLEYNNPGNTITGEREHWIGVSESSLPASSIQIFLDGAPLDTPGQAEALLASLGSAWPRWPEPLPFGPSRRKASETLEMSQAGPRFPASVDAWNACVVDFYQLAILTGPLKASVQMLTRLVPGTMQLAFTATSGGEVNFATSCANEGQQFLLSTMGTTDSHPLIYQCRGQVKAISDVLSPRDWHQRAMYQAARPHFSMEDALGTDMVLNNGALLNICTLRDQQGFTKDERRALRLFAPHIQSAYAFSPLQTTTENGDGSMHVISLKTLPGRQSQALSEIRHQYARYAQTAGSEWDTLKAWFTHHSRKSGSGANILRLPLSGSTSAHVLCLPPTGERDGAIVFAGQ